MVIIVIVVVAIVVFVVIVVVVVVANVNGKCMGVYYMHRHLQHKMHAVS